jgi:hypothetical protein
MPLELYGYRNIYPRHQWTEILRRRKKNRDAKLHRRAIAIALATKRNREGKHEAA